MKGLWQKTRVIAWAWVLAAALLLSACAGPGGRAAPEDDHAPEEGWGYFLERGELPGDMALSTGQFIRDESLYLCGMDRDNAPLLYRCRGEALTAYPLPEDARFLHACCADGDGLAVLAGDFPALWTDALGNDRWGGQEGGALFLLRYGADGGTPERIALDVPTVQGLRIVSLCRAGVYYSLLCDNALFLLDAQGSLCGSRVLEGGLFTAQIETPRGLAVALYSSSADGGDDSAHVELLADPDAFRFETLYIDTEQLIKSLGCSEDGRLLLNLDGAIRRLEPDGESLTVLVDLRSAGTAGLLFQEIFAGPDMLLLAGTEQRSIDRLVFGELPEKEELLLWSLGFSVDLPKLVSAFNRDNPRYQLRVEQLDADNSAALGAEIAAGRGPDLILQNLGGWLGSFSGEGVLEDLLPWLESAEGPGRDSLLPSVLAAAMENGRLYALPLTMELHPLTCRRADLAPPGTSLEEAAALPQVRDGELSLFTGELARGSLWSWLRNVYLAGHLDTERGVCDFETEEYRWLLSLCRDTEPDEETVLRLNDPQKSCVYALEQFISFDRLLALQKQYGERLCLTGSMTGTGLIVWVALSVPAACPHREGALAFIRYALRSELFLDSSDGLPVSRELLERQMALAASRGIWDYETESYVPLEESTLAQFRALLEQPMIVLNRYPELIRIMDEEAERFFAGDRTAEEAAAATQSRAAIYMAERFG